MMQDPEHEEEYEKVLVDVRTRKVATEEEVREELKEEELVRLIPRRWYIY